jgi:5-methyltetrahydrofolate--homocysteine methyltransferase
LLSVGFNCALGADQLKPYVQRLGQHAQCFVSAHPNAGLPNAFGEYDQTPQQMCDLIEPYMIDGLVNIIGGCCGSTPAHIQLLAQAASTHTPRKISQDV